MKKTLPLILGCGLGGLLLVDFFVPHHALHAFSARVLGWVVILGACAFIVGGINLVQVTWPKIRKREADWQYKVVMLAAAAVMTVVGLPWPSARDASRLELVAHDANLAARGQARLEMAGAPDVVAKVEGRTLLPLTPEGKRAGLELSPGAHEVTARHRASGSHEFAATHVMAAGEVWQLKADPPAQWGVDGRVRTWLYDYVFSPCTATMFALLAFFVASAAFRAFRARSIEAALLLGSAIIVLLARAPMGRALSQSLPAISDWLLAIPNNGSRRAIMVGAALGAIATGLRVVLGIERSHLGGE